ncbi:MAG: hypothetical protein WCG28_00215 [bacterium]
MFSEDNKLNVSIDSSFSNINKNHFDKVNVMVSFTLLLIMSFLKMAVSHDINIANIIAGVSWSILGGFLISFFLKNVNNKKKIIILCVIGIVGFYFSLMHFGSYSVNSSLDAERIYNLAIQKHDIVICDKINLSGFGDVTTGELISICYRRYVDIYPNEGVCSRRPGDTMCNLESAKTSGDPQVCDGDPYCVALVASKKKDLKICDNFLSPNVQLDNNFPSTSPFYKESPQQKCRWYISKNYFSSF